MTKPKLPKTPTALLDFQREKQSDMVIRSVNLTRAQYDFLERHSVNLSKFVRDCLDKIIEKSNKD